MTTISSTCVEATLLAVALRHIINEPNIEAGFEHFTAVTDGNIAYDEFCEAVAACLRDGLIREPIRLPEGALQCHWHLELTPKGVAAARAAPFNRRKFHEKGLDHSDTDLQVNQS